MQLIHMLMLKHFLSILVSVSMARIVGIYFPFTNDPTGFPKKVYPDDVYVQSIMQILLTRIGERVMLPEFGSRLYELLFENAGDVTENAIRDEVIRAVSLWEPRVRIEDVRVEFFDDGHAKVTIIFRVLGRIESQEMILDVMR